MLVAAATLAAVTLAALEGGEVVVISTHGAGNAVRRTRVWIATDGESDWLEANNPSTPWYLDVVANDALTVERGGTTERYRARPLATADGHARIRALMSAKYGWADRWVGWLFSEPESVAVRLEPGPGTAADAQRSTFPDGTPITTVSETYHEA